MIVAAVIIDRGDRLKAGAASTSTTMIVVAGRNKGRSLGSMICHGLKAGTAGSIMAASTPIIVLAGRKKGTFLALICHGMKAAAAATGTSAMIISRGNESAAIVLKCCLLLLFFCSPVFCFCRLRQKERSRWRCCTFGLDQRCGRVAEDKEE